MSAPELAALRERLAAFEVDDPVAAFPFSARLARENGWSRAYALRVVEEYKRFVLLCLISDRPPCPSEQVDEAWHLHLTFTRSYWTEFCGQILQRPLHHEPTRGGGEEHVKHVELYEHTLALYRTTFGAEPPREIWPPSAIRFGEDTQHRKVNVGRNWIIPNPFAQLRRWRLKFAPLTLACLPLAAVWWNPLDWSGLEFLAFFSACYAVAILLGLWLRSWLRNESPAKLHPPLTTLEIAQLARGKRGAITAALSQLVSNDVLRLEQTNNTLLGWTVSTRQRLVAGTRTPGTYLEESLAGAILSDSNVTLKGLNEAAGDALDRIEAKLVNRGLVHEWQDVLLARIVPTALMALVFLLGLAKIYIGVSREKPVGSLVFGCVVVIGTLVYFALNIRRTRAGDELIAELQAKHSAWKTPATNAAGISAADVAFAVALFGTGALAGSAYANLSDWERQSFGNDTPYSGSGCSGGCGGGGGGGAGCGGGGGGGCGGG